MQTLMHCFTEWSRYFHRLSLLCRMIQEEFFRMISILKPPAFRGIESQSNNLHQLKSQPWCYWNARILGIWDSLRSREFREQIRILQNISMAPETFVNLLLLLIEYLKCPFHQGGINCGHASLMWSMHYNKSKIEAICRETLKYGSFSCNNIVYALWA